MSTAKLAALGLSIALVGGALLLLTPPTSRPSHDARASVDPARAPAPAARRSSSGVDPSQELAALRHEVRTLAQAVDQGRPAHADDSAAPTPLPADAPAEAESAAIDPSTVAETLDGHLSDEGHDPTATQQASTHIAARLAESEAGELLGVDCGQTLCRTTLAFGDLSQRDARLSDIGSLMPWDADGFFRTDPDDDLRVSVYFSREGQPLPTVGDAS